MEPQSSNNLSLLSAIAFVSFLFVAVLRARLLLKLQKLVSIEKPRKFYFNYFSTRRILKSSIDPIVISIARKIIFFYHIGGLIIFALIAVYIEQMFF